MDEEELKKKLENAQLPGIELTNHRHRLKTALLNGAYFKNKSRETNKVRSISRLRTLWNQPVFRGGIIAVPLAIISIMLLVMNPQMTGVVPGNQTKTTPNSGLITTTTTHTTSTTAASSPTESTTVTITSTQTTLPTTTFSALPNTGWTPMTGALTNFTLHSVWGSSPSDVFAVGDNGTILHYDGTSWNRLGVL